MHHEVYADGIGEITVTGNIVRIDLVSLSPSQRDANGQPQPEFRQRIVMPIEAFANSAELMRKVVAGLLQSGALRMQPVDGAAPSSQGHGSPSAPTSAPEFTSLPEFRFR